MLCEKSINILASKKKIEFLKQCRAGKDDEAGSPPLTLLVRDKVSTPLTLLVRDKVSPPLTLLVMDKVRYYSIQCSGLPRKYKI